MPSGKRSGLIGEYLKYCPMVSFLHCQIFNMTRDVHCRQLSPRSIVRLSNERMIDGDGSAFSGLSISALVSSPLITTVPLQSKPPMSPAATACRNPCTVRGPRWYRV